MTKLRRFFYYIYRLEWKKRHLVRRVAGWAKRRKRVLDGMRQIFNLASWVMMAYGGIMFGIYHATTAEGQEFIAITGSNNIYSVATTTMLLFFVIVLAIGMIDFLLELADKEDWKYDG